MAVANVVAQADERRRAEDDEWVGEERRRLKEGARIAEELIRLRNFGTPEGMQLLEDARLLGVYEIPFDNPGDWLSNELSTLEFAVFVAEGKGRVGDVRQIREELRREFPYDGVRFLLGDA